MGYPMARNLRKGISKDKTLLMCDVNQEAITGFRQETEGQGPVNVAASGAECVKAAV